MIKEGEVAISQLEGQKHLFDAKRENVDLQLEALYRQRLAEVHAEVKKRLVRMQSLLTCQLTNAR